MDMRDFSCRIVPDLESLHQPGRKSSPRPLLCTAAIPICNRGLSRLEPGAPKRDNFPLGAGGKLGRPARKPAVAMTQEEERDLREQLARLQEEHRDLDAAIAALQEAPGSDLLQIQRLKKRKLYLRDRISFIDDQLTPDIIA